MVTKSWGGSSIMGLLMVNGILLDKISTPPTMFPAYMDNGGIGTGTTEASVDVPYPSVVNLNNILIAQLLDDAADSFYTPSGWTKITGHTINTDLSDALFWKRATGSESGMETFTSTSSTGALIAGIISRYSGCTTTGTPFEGLESSGITESDLVTVPAVTTLGAKRLVVNFIQVEDDVTVTIATGYTQALQLTTMVGTDATFLVQYQEVATASTTIARTSSIAGRDVFWGSFSIALIPES